LLIPLDLIDIKERKEIRGLKEEKEKEKERISLNRREREKKGKKEGEFYPPSSPSLPFSLLSKKKKKLSILIFSSFIS
jgi:hypothetical protein